MTVAHRPPGSREATPCCRILTAAVPLGFAHRGGAGLWPENTEPAFRGCQELGPLVIETDLRVTRDGKLVVFHDEALDRTTNGHGPIADKTWRQLLLLDAGHWFTHDGKTYPFRGRHLRILTLQELVERLPNALFNVELKAGHPEAPALLSEWLEQCGRSEQFLVASSDHRLLQQFRARSAGRVATSASRREVLEFLLAAKTSLLHRLNPRYQALQVPPEVFGRPWLTPDLVRATHELGLAIHLWTLDDPKQMRHWFDLGVDGIMSDYPDRLAQVLAERASGINSK